MKHVYYGKRNKSEVVVDKSILITMECRLSYETTEIYREVIERCIERLNDGKIDGYIVYNEEFTVDNDVLIIEKEREHVLEIGDKVELGEYNGAVEDRKYDAINDVMHYNTDIVVAIEKNSVEDKGRVSEIKEKIIPRLNRLLEANQGFSNDVDEKRGFWRELFNL